ncbi:DUF2142 domain-containing protein [Agromyces bauzanensis]
MQQGLGNRTPLSRRVIAGISASVLAFIALAAWAFASPVGASPDDDFHLISIWCGAGEREGLCEMPEGAKPDSDSRMVPEELVSDSVCYAFNPAASAACQEGLDSTRLTETDRGNFEALYPPVYYGVMSVFASNDVQSSVLVIRLVNAGVFVGLLTALAWLTPAPRRAVLVLPVVVTAVPLGMFIIPSTNPSSWALASAATLWMAVFNYFEASGRRRWLFAGLAALALLIGAGARADAAVYAGLAIVGVLILQARRTRDFALAALVPVAFILIAIVFYRMAGQANAAVDGLSSEAPSGGLLGEIVNNLFAVPDLWAGMLGRWGLGWLDTQMPAIVWVSSLAAFAGVVFFGLGRDGTRKYVATGLMFAALWGVPTLLQTQTHAPVGAYVQPRYILPIAILVVGFALVKSREPGTELRLAQIVVLVLALGVANAVALHTNIRRYVTGLDASGANLSAGAEWWWSGVPTPMVTWIIGSAAFGLCLAVLGALVSRSSAKASDELREPAALPG